MPTMKKLKTLAHKLRSTEASEIAEAAVVLPLVFMFLLGIVWFGRAFNIYSTIQQAAQQGALAAARPTCATCTAGNPSAAVDTAVAAVMQASSIQPTQIIAGTASGPCTTSPTYKITLCQQVELNSPSAATPPTVACPSLTPPTPTPAQICGTVVTFQFPYQFYLPFTSLNMSTITLTAQAQTRKEN